MTRKEIIQEYKSKVKWETWPKTEGLGGQSIGRIPSVKLISLETDFEICIGAYRSQIRNKDLAATLFELYLNEIVLHD
jgi:protein subunit release factor A